MNKKKCRSRDCSDRILLLHHRVAIADSAKLKVSALLSYYTNDGALQILNGLKAIPFCQVLAKALLKQENIHNQHHQYNCI